MEISECIEVLKEIGDKVGYDRDIQISNFKYDNDLDEVVPVL